jgi:hypothetical protein
MILGHGPSRDYEAFKNFDGLKLVTDIEYIPCNEKKIKTDYAFTLEDSQLSHYFDGPHLDTKPTVVISVRVPDGTRIKLGEEDFNIKVAPHKLVTVCYNVGLMAIIYAVHYLNCEEIYLNGLDHLYPKQEYNSYDLKHHMWREMFWDLLDGGWFQEHVPSPTFYFGVNDEHHDDAIIQQKKDNLIIDTMDFPGFKDMDNYIRYRNGRNERYVRKLNPWQDVNSG